MPRFARELGSLDVKRLSYGSTKGNEMVAVGGVAGLYLQLLPTGGKSWVLRMIVGQRRRDIGLGGYPTVTLAQACEKAREYRSMVEIGTDPIEERKATKSRLVASQRLGLSFQEVVNRALAAKLEAFENEKHRNQWRSTLNRYAIPELGALAADDIDTAAVLKVLGVRHHRPWNSLA